MLHSSCIEASINLDLHLLGSHRNHNLSFKHTTFHQPNMAHPNFTVLLFLLSLVISSSSGKLTLIFKSFTNPLHSQTSVKGTRKKIEERLHVIHQDRAATKSRELLEEDIVELDYDYAGPNPKHDPRRGRGGGRSLWRLSVFLPQNLFLCICVFVS